MIIRAYLAAIPVAANIRLIHFIDRKSRLSLAKHACLVLEARCKRPGSLGRELINLHYKDPRDWNLPLELFRRKTLACMTETSLVLRQFHLTCVLTQRIHLRRSLPMTCAIWIIRSRLHEYAVARVGYVYTLHPVHIRIYISFGSCENSVGSRGAWHAGRSRRANRLV